MSMCRVLSCWKRVFAMTSAFSWQNSTSFCFILYSEAKSACLLQIFISFFFFTYNVVLVLPYINMNPPWVYTCSPSWTPLPPPSQYLPVPSLCVVPVHQPQASSIMHQTWTGNSFHMWYYTCFNAILPNHPTLSLSHRVQKTSIHLCLFCCLTYRAIVTIFLNSIYMH